jgi:hypothetical protein
MIWSKTWAISALDRSPPATTREMARGKSMGAPLTGRRDSCRENCGASDVRRAS